MISNLKDLHSKISKVFAADKESYANILLEKAQTPDKGETVLISGLPDPNQPEIKIYTPLVMFYVERDLVRMDVTPIAAHNDRTMRALVRILEAANSL